jgi:hypothetical protein
VNKATRKALPLLKRAADLAQSVHKDDRETGWCEDVERDIRDAIKILKGEE